MVLSEYVSVSQASTYYEKDNYYQVQIGEYRGRLKDELQLGDLNHSSFQNLLKGINPTTGESLVASKSGQDKQRAAIDICMEAPKSFSVIVELAAAKNDTKLLNSLMDVWDKSVNTTLDHIEKEYSFTRIQKNNTRKEVKTCNFLITKFGHDTSRPVTNKQTKTVAIDPNIHTHNLFMNFTKSPDGKYRSLQAKKLLDANITNGRFLRSELAVNLQKDLGINTVVTDAKQGFIEIEGVPHELLDEYSSRHKQIQEKLIELREKFPNMNETKLQKKAARTSRERKKIIDIDRDEIRKNNLSRAEKIVNVDELLQKFKRPEQELQEATTVAKIQNQNQHEEERLNIIIQNVIKTAEREVKQLPKYKQDVYSVLSSSTVALLGKVPASEVFSHVKKSEQVKQKQLNTMHEVLLHSLKSTKLDTQKLFESLRNTPDIKILIEGKYENAKNRPDRDRDRLIASYLRFDDELTRTKHSHNRDTADLTTTTERGEPRAEFERSHDVDARPTARDHKPYVLTLNELRRDDQIAAERLKQKQQSQEYER